jgi:hypothetical protein
VRRQADQKILLPGAKPKSLVFPLSRDADRPAVFYMAR